MPTLRIDFQDGFEGEPVGLQVNGAAVATGGNLQTKRLTGKAASVSVDVPAGAVDVDVELPQRNLRKTIGLQVTGDMYLGISRTGTGIEHSERSKPFGYA